MLFEANTQFVIFTPVKGVPSSYQVNISQTSELFVWTFVANVTRCCAYRMFADAVHVSIDAIVCTKRSYVAIVQEYTSSCPQAIRRADEDKWLAREITRCSVMVVESRLICCRREEGLRALPQLPIPTGQNRRTPNLS